MTITKLRSGRWRAQIWHQGGWVSVPKVIGSETSYRTKRQAQDAKAEARRRLKGGATPGGTTVAEWRDRWLSDPLFRAPAESTNIVRAERSRAFADRYGDLPLQHIGNLVVAQWLQAGKKGTVPVLRKMFNDARSPIAGCLITTNPFAGLGLEQYKGNKRKQPPSEEQAWTLIRLARDLTSPSFAAYLEVACWSACRPGELDALEWDDIDWDHNEIHVRRQWNVKVKKYTPPKHNNIHTVTLTPPARDALLRARDKRTVGHDRWCFTTNRGNHYTPSTRIHHWNRVRAAAGLGNVSFYLATRHFAGWYMLNILELPPHVIATQLGHRDGGQLVRELYGHPDDAISRRKIHEAYSKSGQVRPLRVVDQETA